MKKLSILQINDTHGYLEAHQELLWSEKGETFKFMGGYARIASIFEKTRRENAAVLCLDSGDTIHGTYPAVQTKGEAFVEPLNTLQIDAMTAHWEFAYGPAHFQELAKKLNYPVLANNCYSKQSGELIFKPWQVFKKGNVKIGVIGIAATIIDKTMPKHFSEGIRFTNGTAELQGNIEELKKQGVDLVVLLSHLGFPQDVSIAEQFDGIDVIVSGHTHDRLQVPRFANDTIIIQSGCHGSFIGKLDLEIENSQVKGWHHDFIHVDDRWSENEEMHQMVQEIMKPFRAELDKVVGKTSIPLHRNTILSAPMDDFLLAAITDCAKTEIGFSNGWRYGAPIPPGDITMNDLWNIIPTNPPVSTVDMTGAEIVQMIEENLERTFSADPFGHMGGYVKRCTGLKLYIKVENPKGMRVQEVFTGNGPLKRDDRYKVAFVTEQGVPVKYGINRTDLGIHAVDAMKIYLQEHEVSAALSKSTVLAI